MKHITHRQKAVKLLALLLCFVLLLPCFAACKSKDKLDQLTPPTDEELIRERIQTFLVAYNEGDMETVLTCLDAKSRNAMEAMLNLLGGVAGKFTGIGIDLKDLFSLGVAMTEDDFMKLELGEITIIDDENAVAVTTMNLTGAGVNTIYFKMKYEHDGWYISDMTDKEPTDGNGSSTQNPDGSGSSDSTLYYVTTYSDTSEYGTAGTYTEYNKTNFAVGSKVLLEATVNDGFNFEGWYLSEGWNSVCLSTDLTYQYEVKASNANIEARYSYYTVNVNADGDNYGMAGTYTKYADKKISVGDTVVLVATVNSGYNFEGWYAEWSDVCLSSDLRYEFEMKADNVNITARYSYYTVTADAWGDEHGTAGTFTVYENQKFSVGDTVVLEATVNDGFNFDGWYYPNTDICLSNELVYQFVMKAENVYIEARYSYYTLTVDGWNEYGAAGTYTKKDAEKISVGKSVTLTATVNSGYRFEGWYRGNVCVCNNPTYTFYMEAENIYIEPRYTAIDS